MVIFISKKVYIWCVESTCWGPTAKQTRPNVAEKLNVMVVSSLFSMQVLSHIPLSGVQAQNSKLWMQFGC